MAPWLMLFGDFALVHMLFDQKEKSYLFFSLFSLISYLEKSRGRFREKRRVKREK